MIHANIKDLDLAYIAGLFDGEGSVGVYVNHQNGYSHHDYSLTIASTFRPVLDWTQETIGLGMIYTRRILKLHHKDGYIWTIHRMQDIHDFLSVIEPYIKIKTNQVGVMLTLLKSRLEKRTNSSLTHTYPYWDVIEEELVGLLREFNKTGVGLRR